MKVYKIVWVLLMGLCCVPVYAQEINYDKLIEESVAINVTAPFQGFIQGFIAVPRGAVKLQATALLALDAIASKVYTNIEGALPADIRSSGEVYAYKTGQLAGYITFLAALDYCFRNTNLYQNLENHQALFRGLLAVTTVPALEMLRRPALWSFNPESFCQ